MKYQLSKKNPAKRAFITGAASGLGRSLALELAKDGWLIGISDLNEAGLQQVASEIVSNGGKALHYKLDVSDSNQFQAVAEIFLNEAGGIDLLVNNAGIGDAGTVGEYSLENWHRIIGINQMGAVYGCHFFVPQFRKQQSGHIINIASAAAFANTPSMTGYNVSKAAVLSLSESLSGELAHDKVSVSVVMPTFFESNLMNHFDDTDPDRAMGKHLIATSGLPSDQVAQTILKCADKRKFYIILPKRAKMFYYFKRFAPNLFMKMNAMLFAKRNVLRQKIKEKYAKLK